ncbi:MAG: hypothetical protein RL133_275 [Pseudomonadota bacterium]
MSLVQVESFDWGCTRLWLNRPEARNALNQAMREALIAALLEADQLDETRVILIQGRGKHFCAGGDLLEFAQDTPERLRARGADRIWAVLGSLRKPVIAAVHGVAAGAGCELALSADLLIAADDAELGQPEVGWGLIPGGGATQRLVHRIGYAQAARMVLCGLRTRADDMAHSGLVSAVVPSEALEKAALDHAQLLAQRSPAALQLAKTALRAAESLPLGQGMAFERRAFESLFGTPDQREGASAFQDRRSPHF